MTETNVTAAPQTAGLEGVVVAESEISFVDGQEGRLIYRGYSIEELAALDIRGGLQAVARRGAADP